MKKSCVIKTENLYTLLAKNKSQLEGLVLMSSISSLHSSKHRLPLSQTNSAEAAPSSAKDPTNNSRHQIHQSDLSTFQKQLENILNIVLPPLSMNDQSLIQPYLKNPISKDLIPLRRLLIKMLAANDAAWTSLDRAACITPEPFKHILVLSKILKRSALLDKNSLLLLFQRSFSHETLTESCLEDVKFFFHSDKVLCFFEYLMQTSLDDLTLKALSTTDLPRQQLREFFLTLKKYHSKHMLIIKLIENALADLHFELAIDASSALKEGMYKAALVSLFLAKCHCFFLQSKNLKKWIDLVRHDQHLSEKVAFSICEILLSHIKMIRNNQPNFSFDTAWKEVLSTYQLSDIDKGFLFNFLIPSMIALLKKEGLFHFAYSLLKPHNPFESLRYFFTYQCMAVSKYSESELETLKTYIFNNDIDSSCFLVNLTLLDLDYIEKLEGNQDMRFLSKWKDFFLLFQKIKQTSEKELLFTLNNGEKICFNHEHLRKLCEAYLSEGYEALETFRNTSLNEASMPYAYSDFFSWIKMIEDLKKTNN